MRRAAVTAAILAVYAGLVHGAISADQFDQRGVSIEVPKGWRLTLGRINGVVDPVTVFTVSTFPIDRGIRSSGLCSAALQRAWRPSGAYVQLTEERDGASRKRMLGRVPHRPKHFVLRAEGAGGLCTPPDSGELVFQEGGRAFYVFYGFGPRTPKTTRAQAVVLLDNMRIAPRR